MGLVSLQESHKPQDTFLQPTFYKIGKSNHPQGIPSVSRKKVVSDEMEGQWHFFPQIGQYNKVSDCLKLWAQSHGASRVVEQGRKLLRERKKHSFGKDDRLKSESWL